MSDLQDSPSSSSNLETISATPVVATAKDSPAKFYVVAPKKFFILFFVTLGLYTVAWSYQHWAHFKRATKDDDIWPGPRGLFSIFFIHSLGRMIEGTLKQKAIKQGWDSGPVATMFVIVYLGINVLDRMAARGIGSPITDILSLVLLPLLCNQLYSFQQAANGACDDAKGTSNSRLNWVNWVWIVLGSVLWLLILIGTLDAVLHAN